MAPKNVRRTFRLAVVDRAGLAAELESIAREKGWPVEVLSCSSALEIVGEKLACLNNYRLVLGDSET